MGDHSYGKGDHSYGKGAETSEATDNLYVTNLPEGIDDSTLNQLFSQVGQVMQSKVLPSKGQGQKSAALVPALNGQILPGLEEAVVVRFAHQKGKGKGDK